MSIGKSKHSGQARDPHDWYVEPAWCVEALAQHVRFIGHIYDPCCGEGTICRTLGASGSDIVDRGAPGAGVFDFRDIVTPLVNVVSNPPYGQAVEFIEHFLPLVRGKLAVIQRLDFLASQRRYRLFERCPPRRILILSRRPSMPPGGAGLKAIGGQHDYCWLVWSAFAPAGAVTSLEWIKP